MISTLAMFGNNSWWHAVATGNETLSVPTNDSIIRSLISICQTGAIPFTGYQLTTESFSTAVEYCTRVNEGYNNNDVDDQAIQLRSIVYGWFYSFHDRGDDDKTTVNILDATTFFANEAVLTAGADLRYVQGAKWVFTSEGSVFYQPYKSVGGLIAVTVLIFLQVIALLILTWYIHTTAPVWTDTLDGYAMMRIGAEMERRASGKREKDLDQVWELGRLRFAEEVDLLKLERVDGLVGVQATPAGGEGESRAVEASENAHLMESIAGLFSTGVSQSMVEGQQNEVAPVSERKGATEGKAPEVDRPLLLGLGAPGLITKDMADSKKKATTKGRS